MTQSPGFVGQDWSKQRKLFQTAGVCVHSPTAVHPNTKQAPARPRNSVASKESVTDLPRKTALLSFLWDLQNENWYRNFVYCALRNADPRLPLRSASNYESIIKYSVLGWLLLKRINCTWFGNNKVQQSAQTRLQAQYLQYDFVITKETWKVRG